LTALIPFGAYVVLIVAIAALVASYASFLTWVILALVCISHFCKLILQDNWSADCLMPKVCAELTQDVLAYLSLMTLFTYLSPL